MVGFEAFAARQQLGQPLRIAMWSSGEREVSGRGYSRDSMVEQAALSCQRGGNV